jgi:hypothetical protein
MRAAIGQTPEAARKRLEPPRIVCDLSVENATCDTRAIVRKVAEMFRNNGVFNNYEQGRDGSVVGRCRAIMEPIVARVRRRRLNCPVCEAMRQNRADDPRDSPAPVGAGSQGLSASSPTRGTPARLPRWGPRPGRRQKHLSRVWRLRPSTSSGRGEPVEPRGGRGARGHPRRVAGSGARVRVSAGAVAGCGPGLRVSTGGLP